MRFSLLIVTFVAFLLSGCAGNPRVTAPVTQPGAGVNGRVRGGQQPVSGATVQLWAVGTATDGAAATALITSLIVTTSDGTGVGGNASNGFNKLAAGYFTLTGLYTCPTQSTLVYLTAAGGNPGLTAGTNNAASVLISALGTCGSLNSSTLINLDEVTTVAAVEALATYMSSYTAIGSGTNGTAGLSSAFTLATELANTATGLSPGVNVPAGMVVPAQTINTLADVLAACVNSTGGAAGDGSECGDLFSAANEGAPPTNTAAAMLNIVNNAYDNVQPLFNLATSSTPFQPTLLTPPTSWKTLLAAANPALTVSPSPSPFAATTLFFESSAQTATLTNVSGSSVTLTNFVLGGADQGDFSQTNNCGSALAAGGTCTLNFVFTPIATGLRTAGLEIDSTGAAPVYVALSGTGAAASSAGPVTLSPSGPVVFTATGTQTLTLENTGAGTVNLGPIQFTGSSDFAEINTCGSSLTGSSSCTITITATALANIQSATLSVATDAAANNVFTVAVGSQAGTAPCTFTYSNAVKQAAIGVVDQGDTTWDDKGGVYPLNSLASLLNFPAGTFKQIGIFVYWSQIQKPDGTYDFSAVDTALCSLQAYNVANGDNVQAKLRIPPTSRQINPATQTTVTASPTAALNQGGIPGGTTVIYEPDDSDSKTNSVGAYYLRGTPGDYTAMWKAVNDQLAARYDANTLVSEVSVETCASVDLEPWLQPSDSVSLANVASFTPPYTDAEDLNCLTTAPNAYSSWKLTPLIDVVGAHNCQGDGTAPNCPNSKTEYVDPIYLETTYGNAFGARFGYEENGLRPLNSTDGQSTFTSLVPGANGGPPLYWNVYGTNQSVVTYQPLTPSIPLADLINATQDVGVMFCMTELELNAQTQLGSNGKTPMVTASDLQNLASIVAAGPPGGLDWNNQPCMNR